MISGARILTTSLLAAALVWAADGKKIFSERCAGCHGRDARGGGKGPGLAGSPRLAVVQLRMKEIGLKPGRDLIGCLETTLAELERNKEFDEESQKVENEIG